MAIIWNKNFMPGMGLWFKALILVLEQSSDK